MALTRTKIAALLADASSGDRTAIVALLKHDIRLLGTAQPFATIAAARQVVLAAATRRSLSTAEQVEADEASRFLKEVAAALTRVPADHRTREILKFCANRVHHLRAAKRLIVATPSHERLRASTVRRLANRTKLDPGIVDRFLKAPRTGVLGVARELTGKKYAITAEHVRKLEEQHSDLSVRGDEMVILHGRKRGGS